MKNLILSADGDSVIYSVPDIVAENLSEYCINFCNNWLRNSPDAEKYRTNGYLCYTEEDFIGYLNQYLFPDEKSVFVKNIGLTDYVKNIPEEYSDYPFFNF